MHRWLAGLSLALICLTLACGGDDSETAPVPTASAGGTTLTGLQAQLSAILIQPSEVPEGLEGSAPAFSTNADLAGPYPEVLQKLKDQGRLLGVDVQYIPTAQLDPDSPLKGGVQTSASAYAEATGASESFQETAEEARNNDWQANYPNIEDLQVTEIERPIGDESLWLRISGTECQSRLPTAGSPGEPEPTCPSPAVIVLDNVIFRTGRVRAYLQVVSLFEPAMSTEELLDTVEGWANAVWQRADALPAF